MQDKTLTLEAQINNPLLAEWTGPFGVPPFERIVPEYFAPAFAHAFAAHEAEIAAIAGNPAEPTFANTIEAMELSGAALTRVENLFHVLAGAHTNDAILAIERDLDNARAFERRAVPAVLTTARPARESFPSLDDAGQWRRRNRQQGDHRRDAGTAHRARASARLCHVCSLPARRRHGQDAGGGA